MQLRPTGDVVVEILHGNPFDPETTIVSNFHGIVIAEPYDDETDLHNYHVNYTDDPEGTREEYGEFKGEGDGGPDYYERYENAWIGSVRFEP
jgi:hypothetical protein